MLRLAAGDYVKIVAFGASMTYGMECDPAHGYYDSRAGTRCAWPARAKGLIVSLFPNANLTVVNSARTAWSTRTWAFETVEQNVHFRTADLILYEGSVSDADFTQATVVDSSAALFGTLVNLPQRPAVLSIEVVRAVTRPARGTRRAARSCRARGTVQTFTLNDPFTRSAEKTAWVYCTEWWLPPTWRAPVLEGFGVPAISFRDAVWPNATQPLDNVPSLIWSGGALGGQNGRSFGVENAFIGDAHLGNRTHELIAGVVVAGLLQVRDTLCRNAAIPAEETAPSPSLSSSRYAGHNASQHGCGRHALSTLRPPESEFTAAAHSVAWRYGEDVPGKPGWLGNAVARPKKHLSDEIVFPVTVGPLRRIVLLRLRSYDPSMGRVNASLSQRTTTLAPNSSEVARSSVTSWVVESHWGLPISAPPATKCKSSA